MQVSIITIGDELLSGQVENTNGSWLARRLTTQGATVRAIVTLPDEIVALRDAIADHSDRFDAVVVTGGLGSTPDDVTVDAVGAALDRDLVRHDRTDRLVREEVERIREEYPEFEFDTGRAARRPVGSRAIPNDEGIAPGFVVENVFVLPGVPSEMKPTFDRVAGELEGAMHSRSVFSTVPESHLNDLLRHAGETFDVSIGCYPGDDIEIKRIEIRGESEESVTAARAWFLDQPEVDAETETGGADS